MEKIVDTKAKTNFQSPLKIRKIDFNCPKGYRSTKKNKNKANRKYWDGDKTKLNNLSLVNISQL